MLTNEQVKKYLENPSQCPKCESDFIDDIERTYDGDNIYRYYRCSKCSCKWVETYKLTEVEELE